MQSYHLETKPFLNNSIRKSAKILNMFLVRFAYNLIKILKKNTKRPLLLKKNTDDDLKKIYFERKKFYNEANYTIKCKSLTSVEIVNKIKNLYEKSGNKI